MAAGRFASSLLRSLRSERGMALPTALFAMVASLGLAGAAVMSTVDVQQGSRHDSGSKSAIAAADAGADVAMMRLNREPAALSSAPCLEGATPLSNGWCPAVSGEVGGATYSYQTSKAGVPCGEFDLCVAVTGTAGEVSRRVLLTFDQGPGGPGGGGGEEGKNGKEGGSGSGGGGADGLIGKEGITMSGNADVRVNIGSNGDVVGSGSMTVCGNVRHGIGKKTNVTPSCSGQVTEENVELPPVTSFMPSDIATHNSNGRITTCSNGLPAECQTDGYSSKYSANTPFNPTTRRISLSGSKSLSLGGGDYWLCELSMSGSSELIMVAGSHVRLFFDTPEHCGTTTPVNLSGNVKIVSTGYNSTTQTFDMPGFFILGSTSTATSLFLSGNTGTTDEFVVYAPNTNISISGNATYKGVIAGKTVSMTGSSVLMHDSGFELQPSLNPWYIEETERRKEEEEEKANAAAAYFTPQFYTQCSGAATPTPAANC